MAYIKQNWKNFPDETTPITAERMNHIEDGIYNTLNEIINIIKQRTSPIRTKKALGILYSDTISKENLSHIILEQVVMKEIASKFDKEDLI